MITHYPHANLGHANHGWLDARHHFSFASYQDADRQRFGVLRVINDDVIKAGAGFDTHPHRNMEIITYVREGAITHRDSNGNMGRTVAGDVQVMSAGTGVFHSEFNLESEDTNIFQIWIEPNQLDVKPRWDSYKFPKEPTADSLMLLVSGDGDAPLSIHQDALIYAGHLIEGTQLTHPIKHQAYVLVSEGSVELEGRLLNKGDGLEVAELSFINIKALSDTRVLVIDVPQNTTA
ncbi:MAG: redox-sensitive bicupin YhaK (pirin superfamily) [Candidatus Azotimanducaceae bacterium]|jgi:redox-sensitive bicupin YhaK (pirin superfamily)